MQNASGLFVPNGCVSFSLNVDGTVIASPYGFVSSAIPVVFQLDGNGNLIQPCKLWSNAELNPQNDIGLGTYYLTTFFDQNGARLNSPMWWQFPEAAGATVNISDMTPVATVGGNVIFYPTPSLGVSVTTLAVTAPAAGNFTVAHGLGEAPEAANILMTSGGSIYWQTPQWDATNLYLTASDTGITGTIQLWT